MLVSLATDVDDPVQRLAAIAHSTRVAKEQEQLHRGRLLGDLAQIAAPGLVSRVARAVAGTKLFDRVRPPFNVMVSGDQGPGLPALLRRQPGGGPVSRGPDRRRRGAERDHLLLSRPTPLRVPWPAASSSPSSTTWPSRSTTPWASSSAARSTPRGRPGEPHAALVGRGAGARPPSGNGLSDGDLMEGYRFDRSNTVEVGRPLAVVRVADTAEVQTVLRWASAHRVPVVTRGAGTGLSGGSVAVDGCITLSTERMRRVEIDASARAGHRPAGCAERGGQDGGARRTGSGTRPTRRVSRSAPSAGTWPPTPAGCAA